MGVTPPLLLLGTDEPVPQERILRAGPLRLRLRGTRLLAMDVSGHEVWHGAAFLYRDEGWATPEPVADCTQVEERADGFNVRIEGHVPAACRIDLRIAISGNADGSLVYEARATPVDDLRANRMGLCVLHPPSTFGRQIEVTHVDGRTSASRLPTLVAPWPPFMLVRALRHEYADGAWAYCLLEGDSFELEDQRNNADASFKTYSRSNLMPRPFVLPSGREICQRMTLRVESPLPDARAPAAPVFAVTGPVRAMPALGVGIQASDAVTGVCPQLATALRELAPARLHMSLQSPHDAVHWPAVAGLLAAAGARLRLDIEGLEAAGALQALAPLAAAMAHAGVAPAEVAVFPGMPAVLDAARLAFAGAAIGSGTPYFFAQINRIEGLGAVDFLSFTTSSIVHDAHDDTVMHGLQSLPWLLHTLAENHPQVPVHTGPSAIAAPRSPLGPQPEGDGAQRIALARRDPRTGALFGAAWAAGHVWSLAQAGARAISILQLLGDEGILAANHVRDAQSLRRRPAYFVLQALTGATHLRRIETGADDRVAALWIGRGGTGAVLLANLTGMTFDMAIPGWAAAAPACLDPLAVDAGVGPPWRPAPFTDERLLHLTPWAVWLLQGAAQEENKGAT